jgi:hypothetical protein
MAIQNILIHCEPGMSHSAVMQLPSIACESLMAAASSGSSANQYAISVKRLSSDDVISAIKTHRREHERAAWGSNLVLMDAGALTSYAAYRCCLFLTHDPFTDAADLAARCGLNQDEIRTRIHHALAMASRIFALGDDANAAVAPLIAKPLNNRTLPSMPLRADDTGSAVLVVIHESQESVWARLCKPLKRKYPLYEFVMFSDVCPFERSWRAVIYIGSAVSSRPGARLRDAWAGAVPVLQLSDPGHVRDRARSGTSEPQVVEHGKSGILCPGPQDLVSSFGELIADPVVSRMIARSAQRQIDSTGEWIRLAGDVLQ